MTAALLAALAMAGLPAPVQVVHCWPNTIKVTVTERHGQPVKIVEQRAVYAGCSRRQPRRRS